MTLKIVSWNIWGGQYLTEIIKTLREADADVIGLQEVIQDTDGKNNIAKAIAEELGYNFVFVPNYKVETSRLFKELESKTVEIGNSILSKRKINSFGMHQISDDKKRTVIEAQVTFGKKAVHLFSAHLVHTHQQESADQNQQARNLLELIPAENSILMADVNATPNTDCLKILSGILIDSDPEALAPTWSVYQEGCIVCSSQKIDTRLDYIFTSKDLKSKSFKVFDSKGSDHLPILAEIQI